MGPKVNYCQFSFFMRNFLTLIIMAISLTAMGRDFTFGGLVYTVISEIQKTVRTKAGAGITPGNNVSGVLSIPETVNDGSNDYIVTEIGKFGFKQAKITGELVIPNTITTIGNSAFSGCSGLTGSLIIPNSVISIGEYAFNDCKGFDGTLELPESLAEIGWAAFSGCTGLTGSLVIPNSVKVIGEYAFSKCRGFNGTLKLSESIIAIPMSAFEKCEGLTGELNIPKAVISIGEKAFSDCKGFIGSLIIPDNVENLGCEAFRNCSGFDGELVLSSLLSSIDFGTFCNCSELKSIQFPKSLKKITGYENLKGAFEDCTSLTGSLVIPDCVETIGVRAFSGCSGIEDIIIGNSVTLIEQQSFQNIGNLNLLSLPNSVENIGGSAFYATNIKVINSKATTPPIVSNSVTFSDKTYKEAILTVPEESLDLYRTADVWKNFAQYKTSRINDIANDGIFNITFNADGITIQKVADQTVSIYDIEGRLMDCIISNDDSVSRVLKPGIYIVKIGKFITKIMIK